MWVQIEWKAKISMFTFKIKRQVWVENLKLIMKYQEVEFVSKLMDVDFRQLMDHWIQHLNRFACQDSKGKGRMTIQTEFKAFTNLDIMMYWIHAYLNLLISHVPELNVVRDSIAMPSILLVHTCTISFDL